MSDTYDKKTHVKDDEEYKSSGFMNFISSGNADNEGRAEKLHDIQLDNADAMAAILSDSGVYDAQAVQDFKKGEYEDIEESRKKVVGEMKANTTKAIVTNGVAATVSVGMAGLSGAVNTGALTSASTGIAKAGYAVGTMVNGVGKASGYLGGFLSKNLANAFTVGGKFAFCAAPTLLTYSYNKSVADANADKLENAIAVMADTCAFYDQNHDKLSKDCAATFGTLAEYGSQASAELLEKYAAGELTEEEYNQKLYDITEQFNTDREKLLEEFPDQLKDMGSYHAADYMGTHKMDPDPIIDYCQQLQDTEKRSPGTFDAVREVAEYKYGTANSEFGKFFKTINAKIISICPAVAYLEGAVVKAADSTYDFIRDALRGKDVDSKYQYQTISDIAESIKQDSAKHLSLLEAADEASKEYKEQAESSFKLPDGTAESYGVKTEEQQAEGNNEPETPSGAEPAYGV